MSFKEIEDLSPEQAVTKITRKPIHTLDEEDKAFLRARVSYLDEDQVEVYASILKGEPKKKVAETEEVVETTEEVVAEAAPKKGKK